jgi:CheY-like chemotaxis protein
MELEPALKHILIVEDNFHLRQILKVALTQHGYAVSEAESGATAIRAANIENPDLIVLDLSLPDMDGLQAAQAIKQSQKTAHIPIVGCSAHFGPQWREKALRAGMIEYLQKPVGLADIEAAVEHFVFAER